MNKLVLVLLALAPGMAVADDDCRYSAERTADASTDGIKRIVIHTGAGALKIEGEAGARALHAVGLACTSREAELEELQVRLDRDGDTLRLTAETPDLTFSLRNWFGGIDRRIDLTVRLPSGIALDVDDGSGETHIVDVGPISMADGSGSLRMTRIKGALDVRDGSGEIDIREVEGSVRLSDGSGVVSIADVTGDIVIENDGSGGIEIDDVQGNVTIGNDGSGGIRIERVSGSVRIEEDGSGGIFVAAVKHDVSIEHDGSGDIEVENAGGDLVLGESGSGGIRHDEIGGSVRLHDQDSDHEDQEDGDEER